MKRRVRLALLLLSLIAIFWSTVGMTSSYLNRKTKDVSNTFTFGSVSCEVTESFNRTTKSDVRIKNTGTVKAYLRANVIANWVENGVIVAPYAFSPAPLAGWSRAGDGLYYYQNPVEPGSTTTAMFAAFTQPAAPADHPGAHIEMTILAQAIQAEPADAVIEAWGAGKVAQGGQ